MTTNPKSAEAIIEDVIKRHVKSNHDKSMGRYQIPSYYVEGVEDGVRAALTKADHAEKLATALFLVQAHMRDLMPLPEVICRHVDQVLTGYEASKTQARGEDDIPHEYNSGTPDFLAEKYGRTITDSELPTTGMCMAGAEILDQYITQEAASKSYYGTQSIAHDVYTVMEAFKPTPSEGIPVQVTGHPLPKGTKVIVSKTTSDSISVEVECPEGFALVPIADLVFLRLCIENLKNEPTISMATGTADVLDNEIKAMITAAQGEKGE